MHWQVLYWGYDGRGTEQKLMSAEVLLPEDTKQHLAKNERVHTWHFIIDDSQDWFIQNGLVCEIMQVLDKKEQQHANCDNAD